MNKKLKDHSRGRRVMHVDTSAKLYERKDTGIAYKIIKTGKHKGVGISLKMKKELERKLDADHDRARVYAIVIYYIIKDDLDLFDDLIICGDEDFTSVKEYLFLLFREEEAFSPKEIKSIVHLREEIGDKNIRSYADGVASSYRKRALKSIARRQGGVPLNVVKITYQMFFDKWIEIEEKMNQFGGE